MPRTWTTQVRDVNRASFQIDGEFALFRHVMEGAGTIVYQHENYRGDVVEAKVNPKEPFVKWVGKRVNLMLKEAEG